MATPLTADVQDLRIAFLERDHAFQAQAVRLLVHARMTFVDRAQPTSERDLFRALHTLMHFDRAIRRAEERRGDAYAAVRAAKEARGF